MIVIEQAEPDTMYVPYYDPATVYGDWPYAEYPPYYFGYPSYIGAGVIAAGLAFGAGWAIGRWGNYWGGGFNWGNRNLYVNHYNRTTNVGNNWQHNPAHRQGVRYNNADVAAALRQQQSEGRRRRPDGLSAAAMASRARCRERTAPARVIVPAIAQPAIAPKGGDRAGTG